ncbi:hypothetical protein LNV23_18960 [Paucibacter sp. DJ1R-11]|uniref:hypothetical protein n=1 Tax=Paucibacter sp. DJ1R-11 TaxID=2893556 RepID=UPI0021E383F2|nr:hypothetical protein [Paucibacter sp. DJ1R-11]MCV2365534.1 hypothetical protein [Paucibacter sp. DJ1R-11]
MSHAAPDQSLALAAAASSAQPDPVAPIGTPPGGGRWAWSTEQQAWVSLDEPLAPETAVQE